MEEIPTGSDSARLANTTSLTAVGEPTEWPGHVGGRRRSWVAVAVFWGGGRGDGEGTGGQGAGEGKASWTLHTLQLRRCKTKPSPG